MTYNSQPHPEHEPHNRPGYPPVGQPLSANDPYHQPGAPRPSWQQYVNPESAADYYATQPRSDEDDADDDDEALGRRINWRWLVGITIGVVVLILSAILLHHSGSGSKSSDKPAAHKPSPLTEQWRSAAPASMWSSAIVGDLLVGIECDQRAGPHADGASCVLQGRGLADGQSKWELSGQQLGVSVTAVGDSVVVSGDGVPTGFTNNNAGSEQAHRGTLIVNANDGHVIRRFDNQIAWMYSQQTVVLHEAITQSGRVTFTAINAATGQKRWQFDDAALPDTGVNELAGLLPSGFAPSPLVVGETAVMNGGNATVVRELDTGKDVASVARKAGEPARYIAFLDDKLVRVVPGLRARLEGVNTSNTNTPAWSLDISAAEIPAQCSGMICLSSRPDPGMKVVNPASGNVIAQSSTGAIYVLREGGSVALVRCASKGSFVNPCPLDTARTEVVTTNTGRRLWSGGAPIFVTSTHSADNPRLLVGTAQLGGDATSIVSVSAAGRGTELGTIGRTGLVPATQVQTEPIADSYQPQYLPTLLCSANGQQLVCGTRWQLNQLVSWRLPL